MSGSQGVRDKQMHTKIIMFFFFLEMCFTKKYLQKSIILEKYMIKPFTCTLPRFVFRERLGVFELALGQDWTRARVKP